MKNIVKKHLLQNLHYLKLIGYNYCENINIDSLKKKNFNLPNNLFDLEKNAKFCYLCELSKVRKNVVFAYGNEKSEIVFIGDEPNNTDDEMGTYFTGNSGELLAKMIQNVLFLKKEQVYFTSLVKCKSKNGIKNLHIDSCVPYIYKQIELINPKIVVLLGENVYEYFFKSRGEFSKFRGKELSLLDRTFISTFSPTFLLRNPSLKKEAYYDMLKIKDLMD